MKNIPFISYIRRYWILLCSFAVLLSGALSESLFRVAGTLIYLPLLTVGAVLVALLIRHLFFAQTLDKDVHDSLFVESWKSLSTRDRIIFNLAAMGVLFLGTCWIAAGLVK